MALNVLKDIRKVWSTLNADEIRGLAWRDVSVGLVATSEAVYDAMEDFLAPPAHPDRPVILRSVHPAGGEYKKFDFVLCEAGVAVPRNGYLFDPTEPKAMLGIIAQEQSDNELALARTFPVFRRPVTGRIINRIARENALFTLVTALPNVIPSLIELPWTVGEFATDTAFLTANQVRMALQIAALHGHPTSYGDQKGEIGAIIAGAFGWRALARELVGKIPLGGGLIPKAAIAFAGTYVVGLGLERYNRTGNRLTKAEKREAWEYGLERGKEAAEELAPAAKNGSR